MTLGKQIQFIDTFCLTEKNLQFFKLKVFEWDVLAAALPSLLTYIGLIYWFLFVGLAPVENSFKPARGYL